MTKYVQHKCRNIEAVYIHSRYIKSSVDAYKYLKYFLNRRDTDHILQDNEEFYTLNMEKSIDNWLRPPLDAPGRIQLRG